jgi:fructose-1,6-bisphosphatase/inositol monophosphatase family enzyme
LSQALDAAIHALVREVSERTILPRYRNLAESDVISKASERVADDVVTVADRESEDLLTAGLTQLADIAVVGEEAAYADETVMERLAGDCWIVDPLDGTHNFAHGKPPFGILIARAEAGETVGGWIYDCLTGRFCVAHRGQGAFANGERIDARATGQDPPIAAISLLYFAPGKREAIQRHIAPHYALADIPRCAAEQYPRLALGQNDVSIFERTLPWDHAAGVLWLNEAGGRAARPDGSAYRVDTWDKPGLLAAATPQLWDELAGRRAALA